MPPVFPARARPRTWSQRAVLVVGIVLVLAAVGSAAVAGYVGFRFGQIDRVDDLVLPVAVGDPSNYLIVGTDSRDGLDPTDPDSGGFLGDAGCDCTDTIMVLRLDPKAGTANILSFPRDLYIPIAGTGKTSRINTAHAKGVQVLIDTIQQNFAISINHYVEIDFVGFEELVDAVGGVPMWFDSPVRDANTGLSIPSAECQVLDGENARRFVRSRYLEYQDADGDWQPDGTADLGRITRQQIFIRRAIAKAVGRGAHQSDHAERSRGLRRVERAARRGAQRRRSPRRRRSLRQLRLERAPGLHHPFGPDANQRGRSCRATEHA